MIDSVIDNIDVYIYHSLLLLPFRIKNKALSVRRRYDHVHIHMRPFSLLLVPAFCSIRSLYFNHCGQNKNGIFCYLYIVCVWRIYITTTAVLCSVLFWVSLVVTQTQAFWNIVKRMASQDRQQTANFCIKKGERTIFNAWIYWGDQIGHLGPLLDNELLSFTVFSIKVMCQASRTILAVHVRYVASSFLLFWLVCYAPFWRGFLFNAEDCQQFSC